MHSGPIILVGLPAVGKTTLANAVRALRPEVEVVDLDQYIAQTFGRSPAEIIASEGEVAFRSIEAQALASVPLSGKTILATGAGIVESEANRALLPKLGRVVHLTTNHDIILERMALQKGMRPLVDSATSPREWLEAAHSRRSPLYRAVADSEFDSSRLESEAQIRQTASLFIDLFLS